MQVSILFLVLLLAIPGASAQEFHYFFYDIPPAEPNVIITFKQIAHDLSGISNAVVLSGQILTLKTMKQCSHFQKRNGLVPFTVDSLGKIESLKGSCVLGRYMP